MRFSVTEVQTFRRCRRKWWFGSFNGAAKTPVASKPALRMGSIWHKGCEWWMDGNAPDYPHEEIADMRIGSAPVPFYVLMRIAAERQYAAIATAVKDVLDRELGDDEKYFMNVERDMLEAMAMNYEHVWGTPLPEGFVNVKAEQTLIVDIPGTEHWACPNEERHNLIQIVAGQTPTWVCATCENTHATSTLHQLECTLDGLIMREDSGDFYILERKTYNQRPNVSYLLKNDQYTAYMWAMHQLGRPCSRAAYDGAWKRSEPAKGKKLTVEDLFLRTWITHSALEIDNYGKHLSATAMEMATCVTQGIDAPITYPNPRWEGCWDCDLTSDTEEGICDAMEAGNPAMVKFLLGTQYTDRPVGNRALVWPGVLPTTVETKAGE